jgi:hypothetical protein
VWVKNFALNGLARQLDAIPLNLIVDNDTIKSCSLRVPTFQEGDPASVHPEAVPFDVDRGESPYEDREILDQALFRSFPERVASLRRSWGYEPLLANVWRDAETLAGAFIAARQNSEKAWGCENYELRVSQLAQTEAFACFARHIFSDLPRFREIYNVAIQSYRHRNRLRSRNHPAPELQTDEAPFWVRTGNSHPRERATASSSVQSLRPRALTLTLFVRVCLGDFFIHGIGGGKYDEVTDQIIQSYFGLAVPAYQVLSATLYLPLPTFPASGNDVRAASRLRRELDWNPQRHLTHTQLREPALAQLVSEKERLVREEPSPTDADGRRNWFRALHQITVRMRPYVANMISPADEEVIRLQTEVMANTVLRRRDYAWPLYPEATLRPFLQQFLNLG